MQGSNLFKQVGLGCLKLFEQVSCLTINKLSNKLELSYLFEQVGKVKKVLQVRLVRKVGKVGMGLVGL